MVSGTAYFSSPLGNIRIDAADDYITGINFCETPEATRGTALPVIQVCKTQLREYFDGSRQNFELPLQQQGTPFQQKVWELLLAIPYGRTISYSTLSKQYGNLKAIRAVAAANGRNALAIVVPCHRVIGASQELTGYAGGLWRKKWLLSHEMKYGSGLAELPF